VLSSTRDIIVDKRFFKQAISNSATKPETITTDKHSSYIKAITQLQIQKILNYDGTALDNNVILYENLRTKESIWDYIARI
jgi:transposase-like protein